jgi:hypothetical protein
MSQVARVPGILYVDDAIPGVDGYRARALAGGFASHNVDGQTFHGIGPCLEPDALRAAIAQVWPDATMGLTFFRLSPLGQVEPNYIHSDIGMGDWTAILYLNPHPPDGDGTAFWRHRATHAISGAFIRASAEDLSQWDQWDYVPAKFNRLLLFKSHLFHSRAIAANYGEGDEARLIQVAFLDWPGPPEAIWLT